MKKKAILSSVLTIVLCLSLIAGSTFALFTSESTVNVAVTAGNVDVVASVENLELKTTLPNGNLAETSAKQKDNIVTLDKIVPGDYVTFKIKVHNNSNVTVQYRTIIKVVDDNGLWDGLSVSIGEYTSYDGLTKVSDWAELKPNFADSYVDVRVELPKEAGNEYKLKSCTFAYTVEAVQGNATVTNPDANTTYIYTANDLIALATNVVNGNYYEGKTVLLMDDIDLAGRNFNGIGPANIDTFGGRTFWGTFDGQGHTISNMNIVSDDPETAAAGLFNTVGMNAVIKNVTVKNATVNSIGYAGGIVGYAHTNGAITIENCNVIGSSITAVPTLIGGEYDRGDKVGGIVGYAVGTTVNNCTVKNTTVCGYRDLGGIIGYVNKNSIVTNNAIENVTLVINKIHNYKNYTTSEQYDAGSIYGEIDLEDAATVTVVDNTGIATIKEASVVATAADLKQALTKGGDIILTSDIVLTEAWTPIRVDTANGYHPIANTLSIDGNGHSISGLTQPLLAANSATNITIQNLTIENSTIDCGANSDNDVNAGAFMTYRDGLDNGSLTMKNCHVLNSKITAKAGSQAGGLIGYCSNPNVTIEDCSVVNCEISGEKAGGLIGSYQVATGAFKNCTVSGCTLNGTEYNGQLAGQVFGGGTLTVSGCTYEGGAFGRNVGANVVEE